MSPVVRFRVGDRVRCEREAPAKGTWLRYAGRDGTVATINRRDGEIGISFGGAHLTTWFLPSEVVLVAGQAAHRPSRGDEEGSGA